MTEWVSQTTIVLLLSNVATRDAFSCYCYHFVQLSSATYLDTGNSDHYYYMNETDWHYKSF